MGRPTMTEPRRRGLRARQERIDGAGTGFWEHQGELVATDPVEAVTDAQLIAERSREVSERLVACGVAMLIVQSLEPVEIEHDNGQVPPVALRRLECTVEVTFEGAPVAG